MSDEIEEIKSRIDIVEMVREYIPLQQAGANFRARCPFHQEKSPSFMVSQPKQIWHCFGSCNEGGDIFTYVMKQEGIEFGEALKILAQRAGVILDRQDPRVATRKNGVLDVLEYASRYYAYILKTSPASIKTREYIVSRGIDQAACEMHGIGFSPIDGEALVKILIAKKFPIQAIIDAGLVIKREQGYGFFDRFRGRLMIPIRDIHGNVVGFGGRILEDATGKAAKYINSPDTIAYDKSKIVFGLDRAKHAIRKAGYCILVEGYMDVFAVLSVGMEHVVATSGTALTQDQIRIIKRFTDTFYFAFDADVAGTGATVRGIEMALREGIYVKVITLPRGVDGKSLFKDPDECARKDVVAWRSAVDNAKSFLDFHFERVFFDYKITTDIFLKKKAFMRFLSVLGLVQDRITQDHWIKILSHHVDTSEPILWEELERLTRKQDQRTTAEVSVPVKQEQDRHEEALISLILGNPSLLSSLGTSLTSDMFITQPHQQLFHALFSGVEPSKSAPKEVFDRFILFFENEYAILEEKEQRHILDMLATNIRQRAIKMRIQILKSHMAQAERLGDQSAVQRYTEEFASLVNGT